MQYVILDLEWNTAFSRKRQCYVNEIIEFGAVRLNEDLEVTDSFSSLVRPLIQKKLNSRVKKMTSISNTDVKEAENYDTVLHAFTDWVGDPSDVVIMSWGDMDLRTLIDNNRYYYNDPVIPFVQSYVDLQAYFMQEKELPKSQQIGLSHAAELIETDPDEFTHHRALGDSELSAVLFRAIYNEQTFEDSICDCNSDFYKQLLFKPYYLIDINDPFVDQSDLSCKCIECAAQAELQGEWRSANNSFHATFRCPECGTRYRVNVQFRRLYNQVSVKKQVVKLRPKQKKRHGTAK